MPVLNFWRKDELLMITSIGQTKTSGSLHLQSNRDFFLNTHLIFGQRIIGNNEVIIKNKFILKK